MESIVLSHVRCIEAASRIYFKLKIPVLIDIDSIELMFTMCAMMVYYEKMFNWNKKHVEWDSNHLPDAL